MKPLRIIVLGDISSPPPADQDFTEELKTETWACERQVLRALQRLGHQVRFICLYDRIEPLVDAIHTERPDLIFNLTEQFHDQPFMERNIAGLIELLGIPYTGSGPTGLMLCKNKAITKKLLSYHRLRTPHFAIFHRKQPIASAKQLRFPLFVKGIREEASIGIAQASFVEDEAALRERVAFVHEHLAQDALVEEYIDGRELYVSILGNGRLRVLPLRELHFGKIPEDGPRFATFKMKWDEAYRKRWEIASRPATDLPQELLAQISTICKRAYRVLHIRGYGRIDIRLTADGQVYILEANPNPHIASDEEFALSAQAAGLRYGALLARILQLARRPGME